MTRATGSYPAPVPHAALVVDDQGVLRTGGGPVPPGPVREALARAAVAVGMTGVRHRTAEQAAAELDVPLG